MIRHSVIAVALIVCATWASTALAESEPGIAWQSLNPTQQRLLERLEDQ